MTDHSVQVDLLGRFLRYVKLETTSDDTTGKKPSTTGQADMLKLLYEELLAMGWKDTELLPNGYLIARLPGNVVADPLAFLAHVDTSPDAPGKNVKPLVHENYQGEILRLADGLVIDPALERYLAESIGDTVITSDGTTLLGADDKAGVAELISFAFFLSQNPDHTRPPLELIFTTDEEIGSGVADFPMDKVKARRAYTLDGGEMGEIEDECYNAFKIQIAFTGISHHPGDARGKLVNAVNMASSLIQVLPRSESPEATDGRYGCLWVGSIEGGIESCTLEILIRDFSLAECERRIALVESASKTVELVFPGGKCILKTVKQYSNMKGTIGRDMRLIQFLEEALVRVGVPPIYKPIRGGTDGARLTELGIPCPNIFAGGVNFHSRREWVPLRAMTAAVKVMGELTRLWAEGDKI